MQTPVIVINMKTYPQSTGTEGRILAGLCQEISLSSAKTIAVAPQQPDLALFTDSFDLPIFAQHVDNVEQGRTTGRTTPEAVKAAGCTGTLINHSEHRVPAATIQALVNRCRELGLITIVCTKNADESRKYSTFRPDYIAVEPPELIGGDVSVTSANPGVVSDSVKLVRNSQPGVNVLCGAGVKNGRDVKKAIELGAQGVLLASGVVKAADQRTVLLDLVSGL